MHITRRKMYARRIEKGRELKLLLEGELEVFRAELEDLERQEPEIKM